MRIEVTTGKVRLSYVNVFKPKAMQPGQDEKYSCTILIPKTDTETKKRIDDAIEQAKKQGADDKWGGVIPPILPIPIHDGDGARPSDGMPYGDECKGHWVLTASAKVDYPPDVVDKNLNPIINQSEIYSGCYARVNITFYPYGGGKTGFKKGIGVGLGPIQKLNDGDPLGGGPKSASSVFGVVEPEEVKINPLTGQPM